MGRDEDKLDYLPSGSERDIPLRANWEGITDENIWQVGLGAAADEVREAARFILSSAIMAAKTRKWLSYSRNSSKYGANIKRYEHVHFSLAYIKKAIGKLEEAGLVEHEKQRRGVRGRQSRIRATPKLMSLAASWGPFVAVERELIWLKDDEKRPKVYDESDETRRMRRQMTAINEAIAALSIDAPHDVFDISSPIVDFNGDSIAPSRRTLVRIFNRTFHFGGRLYRGFWQSLPKQVRQALVLEGGAVAEPDFAQLHAQLLYAYYGVPLAGDAYTVDGVERRISKIAWQILMNSSSEKAAVLALWQNVQKTRDPRLMASCTMSEAARVLKALEHRHREVAHAFYSGIGLRLQFVDSELMLRVMERCIAKGIIGLPVHDSLVVKATDRALVEEVMNDELEFILRELRAGKFRL